MTPVSKSLRNRLFLLFSLASIAISFAISIVSHGYIHRSYLAEIEKNAAALAQRNRETLPDDMNLTQWIVKARAMPLFDVAVKDEQGGFLIAAQNEAMLAKNGAFTYPLFKYRGKQFNQLLIPTTDIAHHTLVLRGIILLVNLLLLPLYYLLASSIAKKCQDA